MPANTKSVRNAAGAAALALAAACSTDTPIAPKAVVAPDAPAMAFDEGTETGTHLVKYGSAGAVTAARSSVTSLGGRVRREIASSNLLYVEGLTDQAAATLAARPGMTVVRDRLMQFLPPREQMSTLVAPNGPAAQGTDQSGAFFFNTYQWYLKVSNANQAWVPSNGGNGETVCVLDTGADPGHSDLAGTYDLTKVLSLILTPRFASDVTPLDYNFHGTFVASLVRSNGLGMASVAPNSRLCSLKVLSEDGNGTFGDVIFGIFLASKLGADVINLSLGGYIQETNPANGPFLAILQEVIDGARNRGSLVVAAAGNGGLNVQDIRDVFGFIHIPSMMKGVVSVGATGPYQQQNFDRITAYSNYGSYDVVDLVAGGGNGGIPGGVLADYVLAACSRYVTFTDCTSGRTYLFGNGTSFSAPIVAGAGAVVESNVGSMTTGALENCLFRTTQFYSPGRKYGRGRVDVRAASLCTGK